MATNSGRGNPIGAEDGPGSDETQPPPVSQEVKEQVRGTEPTGSTKTHMSGQDLGAIPPGATVETEDEMAGAKEGASSQQR